nr:hypothetical protein [Tanacetum cinerariifolium]
MTSFDYRLNPLYPIKECSSCGALYTTDYCCSVESFEDKIIFDLDKTPDLSQRSPQNCPKCGHTVDGHYCKGCAFLRKKFKEDLFTSVVFNQDPGKNSSQSPPQINHHCCYGCGNPLEGIFCHQCTCKLCGNGAYYGYNCPPKVPIIPDPEPVNNQTIKELPPTVQSFDPKSNLVHNCFNVFDPPSQLPFISYEFCRNDARYGHYCTPQVPFIYPEPCYNQYFDFLKYIHDFQREYLCFENCRIPACYDDDDDYYTFAITSNEPVNSLSMGDEHLDTIPATKLDEFIKSSVENLVPILSECDMPVCEAFKTFSNILFDSNYDFYSSDEQSNSDEDLPKEIYSNTLFDEESIPIKIDLHHFNAESDLIESMRNHDSSIISSSNMDSLFDEFTSELTLLKSVSSGIDETDCDPEKETHFIKILFYDNSSPCPPKEFVFENSNAAIESFSPSPILVEGNDSLIEEIDLSFTPDYPMPPSIEEADYDSKRDILFIIKIRR